MEKQLKLRNLSLIFDITQMVRYYLARSVKDAEASICLLQKVNKIRSDWIRRSDITKEITKKILLLR